MNSIDSAIAAAQGAAGNIPAENAAASGQGTAVAPAAQTQVAMPSAGTPMGLNDVMSGAHIVDNWLKVSEHGLQIDGNKPILEEIKATLDLSEIAYTEVIKYGNPAVYEKTNDRQLTASGKPWAQAIIDAKRVDPKARPYSSADLSFVTTEEIKLKDKTIEAGTVLGHSLSTTGFKSFARLVKELKKAGIDPVSAKIELTVGYSEQSGNGNNWGILDFRDFSEV